MELDDLRDKLAHEESKLRIVHGAAVGGASTLATAVFVAGADIVPTEWHAFPGAIGGSVMVVGILFSLFYYFANEFGDGPAYQRNQSHREWMREMRAEIARREARG